METPFYISFSLKTPTGYDVICEFAVGDNREIGYALFDSLYGEEQYKENDLLHINLIETVEGLPVKISSKCCNLEELGCNTKIIVRELFRQKNLKNYEE